MNDKLKKQFVSYNIALELKSIGFEEFCIYAYCNKGGWNKYEMIKEPIIQILKTDGNPFGQFYKGKNFNGNYDPNKNKIQCSAPLYSQVIDWFQENHNIYIGKTGYDDGKNPKRWVYHVDSYYIPEQTLESAIMYAINKIKNK